jgi:hypothetical protein
MKRIAVLVAVFGAIATGCVTSNVQENNIAGRWQLEKITCSDKALESTMNAAVRSQKLAMSYRFDGGNFSEMVAETSLDIGRKVSQESVGTFTDEGKTILLTRDKTDIKENGKTYSIAWTAEDSKKTTSFTKILGEKSLSLTFSTACSKDANGAGTLHFVRI